MALQACYGNYCIWLQGSGVELPLITLWRLINFLTFVAIEIVTFLIAVAQAIVEIITGLEEYIMIALIGLATWAWWFYYPELQPYLSTVGVEVLNLALVLFQLTWDLFLILWNLFVMVWNGMIIYVTIEIAVVLLSEIVKLLGQINVYALLQPFVEILEIVARFVIEVIQALVSVAVSLIRALSKIIGAIVTVIISVTQILFPVVKWILGALFKLLFPVLKIVISIVSWFLNLFAASARALLEAASPETVEKAMLDLLEGGEGAFQRRLFSLEDEALRAGASTVHDTYSSLQEKMWPQANAAAQRYWNDDARNHAANTEIENMLDHIESTPLHSFSYYWTVHRPYLAAVDNGEMPTDVYLGEDTPADGARPVEHYVWKPDARIGKRSLLGLIAERELLSQEDLEVLTMPSGEAVSHRDYWNRHDATDASDDHLEWYSRKHNNHLRARRHASERLKLRIANMRFDTPEEYYEMFSTGANNRSAVPSLNYEEFRRVQDALTTTSSRKRPFVEELDGRVRCRHNVCGGRHRSLPHPVHVLRRLSEQRQKRHDWFEWRFANQNVSDEEHHRRRFVHGQVLAHAVHTSLDRLKWHIQNPMLHKHIKDGWKAATGYEDLGEALDAYHSKYRNPAEWMYDNIGSLSDLPGIRYLAENDPHFDERPWFGDYVRKELGSQDQAPQHHMRKLHSMGWFERKLLEFDTPEERDAYAWWLASEPRDESSHAITLVNKETLTPEEWRTQSPVPTGVPQRQPLGFPIPLPSVPSANSQNDAANEKYQSLQNSKPHPAAKLPLFDLLTKTNCYNSVPRNPLCLPSIPHSWYINKAPQVSWPKNATQDDSFCAPTFKRVHRCLTCWDTYINWRWWYNALQIPRLILSAIPVFTDTLYQLGQTYPFLRWLWKLPLALPPGHRPSALDWVCAAIYGPYALWFTYVTFRIFTMVFPLLQALLQSIMQGWALNAGWASADEARWASYDTMLEKRIQQARVDTPWNPSLRMPGNNWGDSMYYYRGLGGAVPAYYPSYGGDKNIIRDPHGMQALTGGNYGHNVFTTPYLTPNQMTPQLYMQQHSPFTYSADDQTATYSGVPSSTGVPGVRDTGAGIGGGGSSMSPEERHIRWQHDMIDMQLAALSHKLADAMRELGVPHLSTPAVEIHGPERVRWYRRLWDWLVDERVTEADLRQFEKTYDSWLCSFQESLLWRWQASNLAWRNFVERWRFAPASGPFIRRYLVPARASDVQLTAVRLGR